MDLTALLRGDPATLDTFLDDDDALADLIAHATGSPAPAPAFARALASRASPRSWRALWTRGARRLRARRERRGETVVLTEEQVWRAAAAAFAFESLLQAAPPIDPAVLEVRLLRLEEDEAPPPDAVRLLYGDIVAAAPRTSLHTAAALLVARAALPRGVVASLARIDEAAAVAEADPALRPHVARIRVAVLFFAGQYEEAVATFSARPRVEGLGAFRAPIVDAWRLPHRRPRDRVVAAADELTQIVRWADDATPEWARGLGVLAARLERKKRADAVVVRRAFEEALDRVLAVDEARPPDKEVWETELEVVVRQLLERGEADTAAQARARARR